MKRLVSCIILFCIALSLASCAATPEDTFDINAIESYLEIPGVTREEIDAVEALRSSRSSFTYGQMLETEAFMLQDGSYAGFTAQYCELLSNLFGFKFNLRLYQWDELISGLDNLTIDFVGDLTSTPERAGIYYMTYPIAERALRIFTSRDNAELMMEKDVNGLRVGSLSGTIDVGEIKKAYPELIFRVIEVESFAAAAQMLESGQIDVFVTEGVVDPIFEEYSFIRSKEFFPLVYAPVSMTTANPELEPIITVMNKYLAAGGIDKLYEFYRQGDSEYASFKLLNSFTEEEKEYLSELAARNATVKVALEPDNYPVCFYNEADGEFQGIAVDVLAEISGLTGIVFETANDEDALWSEIMEMLRTGRVSMVSQLIHTEERKDDFLWAASAYSSADYALLSKAEFMNLAVYQVVRTKVGAISASAFADRYYEWFPDSDNLVFYDSQDEALNALESGDIDLMMASNYVLLAQLNYREKPGYKLNINFNVSMDSQFGFNKEEEVLCSIISKAQGFVKTSVITGDWTNRGYDYSKRLAQERMIYLAIILGVVLVVLILTVVFLMKNRKFSHGLEVLVKKRTFELERQTEAAQVASKAKSAFLARMSHEIRTPLNAIIGMANIARNSVSNPEKCVSSIDQIVSSSQHLLGILNDVLDMSKIESGKLELAYEPFSSTKAFGEVTNIIMHRCIEKDIEFSTNMEELRDIVIRGDKLRLSQVLINLLGNSVKFTPEGGKIQFTAKVLAEDDNSINVRFSVADNGIGMSEEQISKLFIPFEQTDNTITAKYGGTGLGLSISQNLVGMMGGVIKVESAPGEGSTFYFDLKLDKGEEAAASVDAAPEEVNLKGKRILLVEDVEINRVIIRELLLPTEVTIDEAENGLKGVERFEASDAGYYDLILMDVQMPVLNGYGATRAIRALNREDAGEIPIIALTANAYKEDVEEAFAAGMSDHLSKPIDFDALMRTLVKYLGS